MAIFYHIATFMLHDGRFEPRIPDNRIEMEDYVTPRICVTPTLEDCLTSLPHSGNILKFNADRRGIYKVYRIDTDKLGISEKDIVTDVELYQNDLVPDAKFTNEHWILSPFNVPEEDTMVIVLNNFKMEMQEIFVKHIQEKCQLVKVHSLDYRTHEVVPGETIQFLCHTKKERELLVKILESRVANISVHGANVRFVASGKENLKELYAYHYCIAYAVDNNLSL